MGKSDGKIHALGHSYIGGLAYFVWALPPNAKGTAHMRAKSIEHRERETVSSDGTGCKFSGEQGLLSWTRIAV
jgi:hypothetical protein